jgi:CBS domain-containing protein
MYEVAVKMKELNVGAIPIVDEQKLVGMITDRDIAIRGVAEKRPGSTKVENIMSTQIVTISPNDDARVAIKLMAENQIRRLPVVEGESLIGIVSLGDLALNELTDNQAGDILSDISQHQNSAQH